MNDLVLITSVINTPNVPLSYSNTRSVFSRKDRFAQTKNTIVSIKDKIPNCKIIIVECSDFNIEEYEYLSNNCDYILDIGPKTINKIKNIIESSETILWNGPAGYFENPNFALGSYEIAKKIAEKSKKKQIYSIAGGGDTIAVLNQINVTNNFNFVSTAGGAFLEYLDGRALPGIKALN